MLERFIERLHVITKLDTDTIGFGLFCIPFSALLSIPIAYLFGFNVLLAWGIGYLNAMSFYNYIIFYASKLEDEEEDTTSGS